MCRSWEAPRNRHHLPHGTLLQRPPPSLWRSRWPSTQWWRALPRRCWWFFCHSRDLAHTLVRRLRHCSGVLDEGIPNRVCTWIDETKSTVNQSYPRLSYKYFGPYSVLWRIGDVSYKSELPASPQVTVYCQLCSYTTRYPRFQIYHGGAHAGGNSIMVTPPHGKFSDASSTHRPGACSEWMFYLRRLLRLK